MTMFILETEKKRKKCWALMNSNTSPKLYIKGSKDNIKFKIKKKKIVT